jgi:hypothetical protein
MVGGMEFKTYRVKSKGTGKETLERGFRSIYGRSVVHSVEDNKRK